MKYCSICEKPINEKQKGICNKCNKKRKATKIIIELSQYLDFKKQISKETLMNIGITDNIRINDYLWVLEETNLLKKENNKNYTWVDIKTINEFVEKYSKDHGHSFKTNKKQKTKNQIKCQRCGKTINNGKYCKSCKKIRKNLKNLNKLEKIITPETPFTIQTLQDKTGKETWRIEGKIWDLQEEDLIKKISQDEYELVQSKIEQYRQENEIKEETETKDNKEENNTTITIKTNVKSETNYDEKENIVKNDEKLETKENTIKTDESTFNKTNNEEKIIYNKKPGFEWVTYTFIDDDTVNLTEHETFKDADAYKKSNRKNTKIYLSQLFTLTIKEKDIKYIKAIKKCYINENNSKTLESVKLFNIDKVNEAINKTKTAINEEVTNDDENKDTTITNKTIKNKNITPEEKTARRINEYIDNYVEILPRPVKSGDVSYNDIYENYTKFLKDEYNETINEASFRKNFSSILFKHSGAYKSFFGYKTLYNVTLHYPKDKTTEPYNNTNLALIKEYIENYVEILSRPVMSSDVSYDDIYENYNKFLKDEYNEGIDKEIFQNNFSKILFKYPGVYRTFHNEKDLYNIKLHYPQEETLEQEELKYSTTSDKNNNMDKTVDESSNIKEVLPIEISSKIEEYVENYLELLPNTSTTIDDIYTNFSKYLAVEHNKKVSKQVFMNYFDKIITQYPAIKKLFISGVCNVIPRYPKKTDSILTKNTRSIDENVKKQVTNVVDKILNREDMPSEITVDPEIKENIEQTTKKESIQKTLQHIIHEKNKVKKPKKEIPQIKISEKDESIQEVSSKIFKASFNNKKLFIIKSILNITNYDKFLILISNTREYITNISMQRLDENHMNLIMEFTTNDDKLLNLIKRYTWD